MSDDVVQDTIMVYHAGYEIYCHPRFGFFDWFGLYPLSEFIHRDQQVLYLMASSFKGSDHIESPDRKGPSDGDCL